MPETKRQNIKKLQRRAALPKYFRVGAIVALCLTILIVGIGLYRARNFETFRMKGFPTELSKDVVATVNGYERTETEGDVKKYFIKADKATTFADNHQEMENVYVEVFDDKSDKFDKISASKAVYIPAADGTKNFTAFLAGTINILTRDELQIKTEQATYTKATETIEAEETVEFSRENISGKSFGAIAKIQEKTLELLKDVEIETVGGEGEFAKVRFAKITSGYAFLNMPEERVDFNENVFVNVVPNGNAGELSQPSEIKSDKASAYFTEKQLKKIDLDGNVFVYQKPSGNSPKWSKINANRAVALIEKEVKCIELFDNVQIETTQNQAKPTRIKSGYALYEKDADRFTLDKGVEIITIESNQPAVITSNDAVYEQSNGRIFLNGNAEITNGGNYIKGDKLTAELFASKKIKSAQAFGNAFLRQSDSEKTAEISANELNATFNENQKMQTANASGNAFLRQKTEERTTEVSANELNANFNENQQLQTANAIGQSNAVLIPVQATEYSKVTLFAPNAIRLNFRENGLLEQMQTDGRTTILMNAPNNKPDAANKKLTADTVKTYFHANGKDLAKAEAIGNAELYVEPLRALAENYKTTINAARFDCDFFDVGNNAKNCTAQTKTKLVRVPTIPSENRGNQTLIADRLNANFNQNTQDIERMEAVGNTKFSELDRNGIAENITFTANDEVVRLRGGEPTVWDSRARAKANEIDWDTRNDKSFLRGNVATTYYSQNQTGGATPFGNAKSPVFVTSAEAQFDHKAETGLYTGNARAWQENNYVRAEKLLLQQKEGKLYGESNVQSVLYDMKRVENGKPSNVPVSASSQKIYYFKENNVLRYETDVDIRQGTDRIQAGIANIYLNKNNEFSKGIIENNVIVTQPNRRALGDWAQYTAENEVVVLRGNPARVEDSESGTSQAAQLTVSMRTKQVLSEGKTNQTNTGRTRTVYKVKPQ